MVRCTRQIGAARRCHQHDRSGAAHSSGGPVGLFRKSDREAFGVASAIFALLAVLFAFAAMFVAANKETTSAAGPRPARRSA